MDWSEFTLYVSTTVLSTFLGASVAFHLERKKKESEKTKIDAAAGNRALFALNRQYGILNQIKNQVIDPVPSDPSSWLNIPATLPRSHDDLKFNIGELNFLLGSKNPNILNALLIEEDRFFEAIKTLNERSAYHRKVLQPKLVKLKVEKDTAYPAHVIESALGMDTVGTMKTLTSSLVEHVSEGMEGIRGAYKDLREVLVDLFQKETIIRVEFPTNNAQPEHPGDGDTAVVFEK